jgi:long-chain acyl-CoA synthetase
MTRPFAWEKSYPAGVRWNAPLTPSTLPALFADAMARHGTRNAIEFRDRWLSFDALAAAVDRTAAAFLRAGLGRDRSIAIYLPNTPYHPVALFAAAKAGARGVLLSPLDAERERAHKLEDSEARTLVTTNFASMMPTAIKLLDAGLVDRVIVGDDAAWGESPIPLAPIPDRRDVVSLASFAAEGGPPAAWPSVTPDQIALLQYTGGTTGLPKGAILTHANLTIAVGMYDAWLIGQGLSRPGQDRIVCALPLFHIYALTTILLRYIRHGNEILLRVRFDAESVLATSRRSTRPRSAACRRCGSRSRARPASSAATSRPCAIAPPAAPPCRSRSASAVRASSAGSWSAAGA